MAAPQLIDATFPGQDRPRTSDRRPRGDETGAAFAPHLPGDPTEALRLSGTATAALGPVAASAKLQAAPSVHSKPVALVPGTATPTTPVQAPASAAWAPQSSGTPKASVPAFGATPLQGLSVNTGSPSPASAGVAPATPVMNTFTNTGAAPAETMLQAMPGAQGKPLSGTGAVPTQGPALPPTPTHASNNPAASPVFQALPNGNAQGAPLAKGAGAVNAAGNLLTAGQASAIPVNTAGDASGAVQGGNTGSGSAAALVSGPQASTTATGQPTPIADSAPEIQPLGATLQARPTPAAIAQSGGGTTGKLGKPAGELSMTAPTATGSSPVAASPQGITPTASPSQPTTPASAPVEPVDIPAELTDAGAPSPEGDADLRPPEQMQSQRAEAHLAVRQSAGQTHGTRMDAAAIAALAARMVRRFQDGSTRFEIRIDPPELGRVDVRLETDARGRTRAHLVVERAEAMNELQKHIRQLERGLQESGLNMAEDGFSLSLADSGGNAGFADHREASGQTEQSASSHAAENPSAPNDPLALAEVESVYGFAVLHPTRVNVVA